MIIQNMFYDDIDRKINGVVKVDQSTEEVLKQEIKEYVITKDIRRHLIDFLIIMEVLLKNPRRMWVYGFPAFLEAVNLIFSKCFLIC